MRNKNLHIQVHSEMIIQNCIIQYKMRFAEQLVILFLTFIVTNCKLAQVVSFFRHGSRYTLSSLYDGNQTKYTWGELTSTGMRQHQTFGQIIRKDYIDKLGFLSQKYDKEQIQVYSTAVNRTIQSVISQLYGLYSLGSGPSLLKVNPEYYIPPYSNKTDDKDSTFAIPKGHQIIPIKFDQKVMMDYCSHQNTQQEKNVQLQIDQYREMNVTYWPFIRKMATMFNLTGNVTLSTLATLNGDIDCDQYLARKLPASFTAEDQRNLKHIDSWYKQLLLCKNLSKAMTKNRFNKILSVFDSRIANPNQSLKWTFLSGHDTDLLATYTELNFSSSQCVEQLYRKGSTSALNCQQYPEFAASLIFELYVEGGLSTIKIRSNGKYMNLCGQKSTECRYEQWKNRIKQSMISDEQVETICGKKTFSTNKKYEDQQSEVKTLNQKYRARQIEIIQE